MSSEPDIAAILNGTSLLKQADVDILEAAGSSPGLENVRGRFNSMRSDIEGGDTAKAKAQQAGVVAFLLGMHEEAVGILAKATGNGVAGFYCGLALSAIGRHGQAADAYEGAAKSGYDAIECVLRQAGAVRAQGQVDEAEQMLRGVARDAAGRAEYSFQMGCIWADRGDALSAVEYFERAVDMDPHHSRALFWLASENALRGNDEEAVRLYEQSLSKPPHYIGALINLGLLYEDRENYSAAAYCFRRVLEFYPNHQRARLYLRDIDAASDQYYDEDTARREARMTQLLSKPATDFEPSVRSRNCLSAMGIHAIGDLTETSEQELLAGKNFGETSLVEIRDMMNSLGLRIGQNRHKVQARDHASEMATLSPQEQALMTKPVTDLNLSVRARKCMARLGITTLGQLVQRTPDELLSSRNFGVTSLNEIRGRLTEAGLKLRND